MDLKRKRLSLREKVKVIESAEIEKLSLRHLGEKFSISKNQVHNILKSKDEIKKLWIMNSDENSKTVKFRKTESCEIDSIVLNWFSSVRAKNIPISGVLLQEKAKEVAENLGVMDFKASNGWLEKFRKRHNISLKSVCGEEKSVNEEQVTEWLEKIGGICEGYELKNIFNADETGLFFRVLPNKTLCFKGEKCSGGKASKERLTVLLCSNAEGDFELPLVIGKAKKPRCFKNIDTKSLPVKWESNRKAWMTTDIMSNWLLALDKKIHQANRKILLFMDNATSHPQNLKLKAVKVVFLPPNTTSILQPMDQGIIKNFKIIYRKMFLRHILARSSSCKIADEVAKCVNVLNAIQWIKAAVNSIPQSCVKGCFRKSGFKITNENKVVCDIQENEELYQLVRDIDSDLTVEEYVSLDEQLCTDNTSEDIMQYIPSTSAELNDDLHENDEEESDDQDKCDVTNVNDALKYCTELQKFFLNVGDSKGLDLINKLNEHVEKNACQLKNRKQASVTDYFK